MELTCTVGSRGRITLPKQIRQRLRLRAGDEVEFIVKGDRVLMQRHRANPFGRYEGVLGTFPGGRKGINAWLNELRGGHP